MGPVLVGVLLLASFAMADSGSDAVLACKSNFDAIKIHGGCEALKELADCLSIVAPETAAMPLKSLANMILIASKRTTSCIDPNNAPLHRQGRDAGANIYTIQSSITALQAETPTVSTAVSTAVSQATSDTTNALNSMGSGIAPAASTTIAATASRLSVLDSLVADTSRQSNDLPTTIANIRAELSQRIVSEANLRGTVYTNVNAQISTLTSNAAAVFASASSARSTIASSMSTNIYGQLSTGMSGVLSQTARQNSRGVLDAGLISTAVASASSAVYASLTASLSTEASRSINNCTGQVAVILNNPGVPTTSSSQDYTSCTSAQAGQVFYSTNSNRLFVCSGLFWQSFFTGGFTDSTTMSTTQQQSMTAVVGSRWVLCYRLSKHGANGWTWRSLCNNRGPSVSIMRGNGYIFGGYVDGFWNYRFGGYFYQSQGCTTNAFVFRFNPSTPSFLDRAYFNGGYGSYNCFWDHVSYGPTWGFNQNGGAYADLRVEQSMNTYYRYIGYAGSWNLWSGSVAFGSSYNCNFFDNICCNNCGGYSLSEFEQYVQI